MNYKKMAQMALQTALMIRSKAGLGLTDPVCPYDICAEMKIGVKFVDINMEGMYVREPKPRILISSLRPLARRNFTCGHELGHHIFGHGSTLDHLVNDREKSNYKIPEEFLADSFASFLLIPAVGIRKAFSSRGWNPKTATPSQIYTIACNFGVGYTTLIYHLAYSLKYIDSTKVKSLLRSSPQSVREEILGFISSQSLIIVDNYWMAKTVDVEVGTKILLPKGVLPLNEKLIPVEESGLDNLFHARSPGITRISSADNSWAVFVRIMPFQFEGMGKYRHLEGYEED